MSSVCISRCYFNNSSNIKSSELHCFSDASERAYAAVIYLRSIYEDGRVGVNLIASKTKVAPLKKQNIPRLELLGATILVRLAKTVQGALPRNLGLLLILGRFYDCVTLDKEQQTMAPICFDQSAGDSRRYNSRILEFLFRGKEPGRCSLSRYERKRAGCRKQMVEGP